MTKKVALVLDPEFGVRVEALLKRMPVWILMSKENEEEISRARAASGANNLTTFDLKANEGVQDLLLRAAYSIEDHHGAVSGLPAYDTLEVYGVPVESCPSEMQSELGFKTIDGTVWGFVARKG